MYAIYQLDLIAIIPLPSLSRETGREDSYKVHCLGSDLV